jgi:hypothetical protein
MLSLMSGIEPFDNLQQHGCDLSNVQFNCSSGATSLVYKAVRLSLTSEGEESDDGSDRGDEEPLHARVGCGGLRVLPGASRGQRRLCRRLIALSVFVQSMIICCSKCSSQRIPPIANSVK